MRGSRMSMRYILLVMIFTLIWGSSVFAELDSITPSNIKTKFSDVDNAHWAGKHIAKLSLQSIIQGDDLGKYNPSDQINHQQAITLAIRMMGLEKEALSQTSDSVLTFDVDDFYKPYVVYAIQHQLIAINEAQLTTTLPSEANLIWGKRSASREWVAKIVIRVIDKELEAEAQASEDTGFSDHLAISSWAVGSVKLAVDLKIVTGFEDGQFRPKNIVNRAQMATFLSRADQYLTQRPNQTVIGYVTDFNGSQIKVQTLLGQSRAFMLHADAIVYTSKSETQRLSRTEIKIGYQVYLVEANDQAYYIEIMNEQSPEEIIEGKLVSLNMDDLTVTLMIDNEPQNFSITPSVQVIAMNGGGASLGDLLPASIVILKRSAVLEDPKVTYIQVKEIPLNKIIQGELVDIGVSGEINVKNLYTNELESYPLAEQFIITKDTMILTNQEVFPGNLVELVIEDSIAVSMIVTQQLVEKLIEGRNLTSVLEKNELINIEYLDDGELDVFRLADHVTVVLEGMINPLLKDVLLDDKVRLEINNNRVERIIVLDRSLQSNLMNTIVSYNANLKALTLLDENNTFTTYTVLPETEIWYDTTPILLANFSVQFTEGKRVLITLTGSKLLSIRYLDKITGEILQINAATKQLTIQSSDEQIYSYVVSDTLIVDNITKSTNGLFTELKIGDQAIFHLNLTQDRIQKISLHKELLYQITAKNELLRTLTVINEDGVSSSHTISNLLPINYMGIVNPQFSNLTIDDYIAITYAGKTVETITYTDSILGVVSEINPLTMKLNVQEFNGVNRLIDLANNFKIRKGNSILTTLDAVKKDDRVEIVRDPEGVYIIKVMEMIERNFLTYDATTRNINLKRTLPGQQITFSLHAKANLHKNNQNIFTSQLIAEDLVKVYVFQGKIIELEIRQ